MQNRTHNIGLGGFQQLRLQDLIISPPKPPKIQFISYLPFAYMETKFLSGYTQGSDILLHFELIKIK